CIRAGWLTTYFRYAARVSLLAILSMVLLLERFVPSIGLHGPSWVDAVLHYAREVDWREPDSDNRVAIDALLSRDDLAGQLCRRRTRSAAGAPSSRSGRRFF